MCLGTGAATLGRLAFYPVEATSFSMQIGKAKTVTEAINLTSGTTIYNPLLKVALHLLNLPF